MPDRPDKSEEQLLIETARKWERKYRSKRSEAEVMRGLRNVSIRLAIDRGVSAVAIARSLGISPQRVLQIGEKTTK